MSDPRLFDLGEPIKVEESGSGRPAVKKHDTGLICACGGRVLIEDHGRAPGVMREFRYEIFCAKCLSCDPNGWQTLKQAREEAARWALEKKS